MPSLDLNQLSGSLKSGLRDLYLLHGEEELRRIEALDQLRTAAKAYGYAKESHIADATQFDWQAMLLQMQSGGLFGEQKYVEIHLPNGKVGKNGGEIFQYIAESPPADTCIVIVLPKLDKAQLQSKWFNALAKHATVLEAKPITPTALPAWIRERLQAHDLAIEPDALGLLMERVEGNLLAAKQEVEKLALLYPAGQTLKLADIESSVSNVARFDVFQVSGAWMGGDVKRVARLLDNLSASGDEPVLLLWSVAEDVRILLRLAAALKQGKTAQSVRQELRLWGDKQTLAQNAVARIAPSRLVAALQECAKIDRQIKGVADGDAWSHLKQLVLRLAV